MKKIMAIAIAAFVFAACNNTSENSTTNSDSTTIQSADSSGGAGYTSPDMNSNVGDSTNRGDSMNSNRDSANRR